jgi:L-ribulose-5-phosphate 4-epimerase
VINLLDELKKKVLEANLELPKRNLVIYSWGNVSGIDRERGLVVIKPSGVPYEQLKAGDLPVVDLDKAFPKIGGVVHTHSPWCTKWAQAGRAIPSFGTTHADYFYGEIPCTRQLTPFEIANHYEKNTGKVIIDTFKDLNPSFIPGVIVNSHGPFNWGKDPIKAYYTQCLSPQINSFDDYLLDKHFLRKHGKNAYYGQIQNVKN